MKTAGTQILVPVQQSKESRLTSITCFVGPGPEDLQNLLHLLCSCGIQR